MDHETKPQPQRFLYLPGVDGTLGAGQRVMEFLPEIACVQADYPSEHSSNLETMADWVVEELLPTSFDRSFDGTPLTICGESFGSALAQVLIERHPKIAMRMILLSSFTSLPRPLIAGLSAKMLRIFPKFMVRLPLRLLARPLLLQKATREERAAFHRSIRDTSFHDTAKRIRALKLFNGRALNTRELPTLWIWGEADTLMDHRDERRWLRDSAPKEQAMMIAEAGHVLVRSQPETLAMHIRRFLGLSPQAAQHLLASNESDHHE